MHGSIQKEWPSDASFEASRVYYHPVPLWPTPWYLRILGFKRWRYREKDHTYKVFSKNAVIWKYVDSIHEIKSYTPPTRDT